MGYMFLPLKRYADFSGRSRRLEFWLWTLLHIVVSGILTIFMLVAMFSAFADLARRAQAGEFDGYTPSEYGSSTVTLNGETYQIPPEVALEAMSGAFGLPFMLLCVWALLTFIPNLAVQVRRLHDQDKSGWMILVGLIPLIGPIWLLVLYLSEGTRGPNQYGPDPKGGIAQPALN
jgi:uncharacterized membrane protein YhaH (DUF805 family)